MTVNSFDLYVANRIQEKRQIAIEALAKKTKRSTGTIRRSIKSINEYLPSEQKIIITDSKIISQFTYTTLIEFIQSLSLVDFVTTPEERFEYLLVSNFLTEYTNLSALYDSLDISQSTKKKDRLLFIQLLEKYQLALNSYRGKGISINGSELSFTILVAQVVSRTIEIDGDFKLSSRKANTPLETIICSLFFTDINLDESQVIRQFLKDNAFTFNYTSEKFLLVYLLLRSFRIKKERLVQSLPNFDFPTPQLSYFKNELEDKALNAVIASLDNLGNSTYQPTPQLQQIATELVDYIENRILTTFYTKQGLGFSIEGYLYKCYFRNKLQFDFYDNKLEDVKKEFAFLYQLVEYFYMQKLKSAYPLDDYQLSTLTLLVREHVLKNKISGRNRKKIVVVTNSAQEKSDFFAQQLIYHFDTEVIAAINIQELYRLKLLKFDHLITFSNRISSILKENGYPNTKVNYYFHQEDLEYLTKLNFSLNSHRKLLADDFVKELNGIEQQQLATFLTKKYPNFFV